MIPTIEFIPAENFGSRFMASKFSRPYRYKNRAAMTNNRTNNKKKLRSVKAI